MLGLNNHEGITTKRLFMQRGLSKYDIIYKMYLKQEGNVKNVLTKDKLVRIKK